MGLRASVATGARHVVLPSRPANGSGRHGSSLRHLRPRRSLARLLSRQPQCGWADPLASGRSGGLEKSRIGGRRGSCLEPQGVEEVTNCSVDLRPQEVLVMRVARTVHPHCLLVELGFDGAGQPLVESSQGHAHWSMALGDEACSLPF